MIEGRFEVQWVNRDSPRATRRYWVHFFAYTVAQNGAQAHEEYVSEDSMLDHLVELQATAMTVERRTARAEEWLLEIHSAGHLSLENVYLTEQQYEPFRRHA